MSLDIGVGLAFLTGRTLTPFRVNAPWTSDPLLQEQVDYTARATVLDLFDLPVPVEYGYECKRRIKQPRLISPWHGAVYDAALVIDSESSIESEDFHSFHNGREYIWRLEQALHCEEDLLIDTHTLGMYSYFFYGGHTALDELRSELHRIRPKRPYRKLAKRIADSFGSFNALHIRRGDFRTSRLSPRAHRVNGAEIARNVARRLSPGERLVVCTDSSSDQNWFAPLHNQFRDLIFLDQLLLHEWASEFSSLPFHDDTVLALITQLVAEEAKLFVGTPFSTFTALIQRSRGLSGKQSSFFYCYSDWNPQFVPFKRCEFLPVEDGPYSWNRTLYPVQPGVHSWFREWPEAFHSGLDSSHTHATPPGTVLLQAREAIIHGIKARYEKSRLLDNIGYWTDVSEYITWNFSTDCRQLCMVEIRYACPAECAGTTIQVGLEDGEKITGKVFSTGDWTTFSSWQRLGTIYLEEGHNEASVRIITMPGDAAFNLAGIRFVPCAN
ncbi:MAG: hypothetical protein WBY53_15850 [Acidobacteriaceae bacterium]